MCIAKGHVRFGSKADIAALFDHLVGACQQSRWDVDTKRTCSLQVEGEFEFGRLQYRKIGRLSAFEDAAGIHADLAEDIGKAGSVAHQEAGCCQLANESARGYSGACRERDQLRPSGGQKSVRRQEEG